MICLAGLARCAMLSKTALLGAFTDLDAELDQRGVRGEICPYGGAVMCLVYDARPSTRDVDAIDVFKILAKYYPHERIRPATRFFIEEIFET